MTARDQIVPTVARIARLALNVADLDRSAAFYRDALGFTMADRGGDRARLSLGAQQIELRAQPHGAPYPTPRAANDPWFQHFAIAVADMAAAYSRLSQHSPEPITRGGPRLLPPSTGSVTAYKFRDPDGHPLELSHVPGSAWTHAPSSGDRVFLGIDHTALAVRDLARSIAFYTKIGFRLGARSLNQGPEQAMLDGLDDATVDIVTLLTPEAGPHIELLHYREPAPSRLAVAPEGIAATVTVLAGAGDGAACAVDLTDPDGHLLHFTS